jgi:hypothetical protein
MHQIGTVILRLYYVTNSTATRVYHWDESRTLFISETLLAGEAKLGHCQKMMLCYN